MGRNVMITGASSGIGEAVALEIGEAGGTVLLGARTEAKLTAAADEVEGGAGIAHVLPCDASDPKEVDRMAAEVVERHRHVDVLINNAGKSIRRSVNQSYDRFHD